MTTTHFLGTLRTREPFVDNAGNRCKFSESAFDTWLTDHARGDDDPILTANHDFRPELAPLATAPRVSKFDGGLRVHFALQTSAHRLQQRQSAVSAAVTEAIRGGFMAGLSFGWRTIASSRCRDGDGQFVTLIREARIGEISAVDKPLLRGSRIEFVDPRQKSKLVPCWPSDSVVAERIAWLFAELGESLPCPRPVHGAKSPSRQQAANAIRVHQIRQQAEAIRAAAR